MSRCLREGGKQVHIAQRSRRSRAGPMLTTLVVLSVGLAMVPAGQADTGPAHGEIDTDGITRITGTVSATGNGELRIDAHPELTVEIHAESIQIERAWQERTILANPGGGGPIVLDTGSPERAFHAHDDARIVLDGTHDDMRALLFPADADARLDIAHHAVRDWPLLGYSEPGVLLDESGPVPQHHPEDDHIFTYRAAGDRFALPADAATASGTLTLYLWGAEYSVENGDGSTTTYETGERRDTELPGLERRILEFHLIHMNGASVHVTGPATAWLRDPLLHLDGTIETTKATGWIETSGQRYALDAIPVAAAGTIQLTPHPRGDAQEQNPGATQVGTSTPVGGVYPGAQMTMTGDLRVLALGGQAVTPGGADLRIAAAAGLGTIGLIGLALTPQGKWLLIGALAPLYAKTDRHRLLEHPHRERLYEAIRANPGVNLSHLNRLTEQGWGSTVHHLQLMERRNLIQSVRRGHERHFFVHDSTMAAARLRVAVAALATKKSPQSVARTIIAHPGQAQSEIAALTGLTPRVVSHHATRLVRSGLVQAQRDGNHVRYWPTPDLKDALETISPSAATPMAGQAMTEMPMAAASA